MFAQIMQNCVGPLLSDLDKSTKENAIGVICVYMGPVHVNPVMEKIKQVSFSEEVNIEIIPFAVFSESDFDEVQKHRSTLGMSIPTQLMKINESSEGLFDIRACLDFLQQQLPAVLLPKIITTPNQFAENLTELLPWAEITTHYFLSPDDDKDDITNYTVDVSIKTAHSHQHKYLTHFYQTLRKAYI